MKNRVEVSSFLAWRGSTFIFSSFSKLPSPPQLFLDLSKSSIVFIVFCLTWHSTKNLYSRKMDLRIFVVDAHSFSTIYFLCTYDCFVKFETRSCRKLAQLCLWQAFCCCFFLQLVRNARLLVIFVLYPARVTAQLSFWLGASSHSGHFSLMDCRGPHL